MKILKKENSHIESLFDFDTIKWWHYATYGALLFILIYISNVEVVFAAEDTYVPAPSWLGEENTEYDNVLVNSIEVATAEVNHDFYIRTFTISAYYSPVQGQTRYVTGSLAGDIRLNGSGVNGADGTPVYPGMIAAPSTYAFGTKMEIPGIGTVAVHDRGGAIKGSRLDVWMGYGDKGLQRALKWGKRTIDVKVYGINDAIKEYITLDDYSADEMTVPAGSGSNTPSNTQFVTSKLFSRQLTVGSTGHDVGQLQELLKSLNYYNGEVNSVFDDATHKAVSKLQVDENIVPAENSYGAGYVGPKTSRILAGLASNLETAHAKSVSVASIEVFIGDLEIGDSGDDVTKLQEELRRFHLLGIDPTGYYGEVTEHAVFKFQQVNRLAGDKTSQGAGIFGPITRGRMNEIVAARLKTEELMEEKGQNS